MKIILEDAKNEEIQITVKGDITDSKVQHILALLKDSTVSSKLILYENDLEQLVNIADIYYFETKDRRLYAATHAARYVCKHTLGELATLFKKQGIVQIGKSLLVNVHHVQSLQAEFSGNYVVHLDNGAELTASRFYMKAFRNAILEV